MKVKDYVKKESRGNGMNFSRNEEMFANMFGDLIPMFTSYASDARDILEHEGVILLTKDSIESVVLYLLDNKRKGINDTIVKFMVDLLQPRFFEYEKWCCSAIYGCGLCIEPSARYLYDDRNSSSQILAYIDKKGGENCFRVDFLGNALTPGIKRLLDRYKFTPIPCSVEDYDLTGKVSVDRSKLNSLGSYYLYV